METVLRNIHIDSLISLCYTVKKDKAITVTGRGGP
jgi:hypothetical protein